ncbi:MAG: hypothetical protein GY750_12525 [Lentisphaerae bacterium]|nr:hypothetical protein [Lentisphaerota bacterium]MCP4102237.1 hypothetical protein [Lentisphaerota bacterium]
MEQINSFLAKAQERLNRLVAVRAFFTAALWGLTGMFITALTFVTRGYRVVLWWFAVPFGASVLIWLYCFIAGYYNRARAARYTDKKFKLKDALSSQLDFADKSGAFYELSRKQTAQLCSKVMLGSIKQPIPRCKLIIVPILLAGTVALSIMDDSLAIRQQRYRKKQLLESTDKINKELSKEIKRIVSTLPEEQKKILKKEHLMQSLNKLSKQDKLKEALKQYGNLENCLSNLMHKIGFDAKKRMLRRIAKELMKDPLTRKFGRKLNSGMYKNAASQFMNNQVVENYPESQSAKSKLEQLQRTLEKMSSSTEANSEKNSLKDKIERLNKSVKKTEQQRQECSNGNCSKQKYIDSLEEMNSDLKQLTEQIGKMQDIKDFQKKLEQMRSTCSRAQMQCRQNATCPGNKPGERPGSTPGQGAGTGAAENFNNQQPVDNNNGYISGIKGIKNNGQSQIKVEEAASGQGSSHRQARNVNAEHKRQFESFIKRDDVPTQLKNGVKEYFTRIHQSERSRE